jgi:hypothetical protein
MFLISFWLELTKLSLQLVFPLHFLLNSTILCIKLALASLSRMMSYLSHCLFFRCQSSKSTQRMSFLNNYFHTRAANPKDLPHWGWNLWLHLCNLGCILIQGFYVVLMRGTLIHNNPLSPTTKAILNIIHHSQVSISFAAKPLADLLDTPHDPSTPFLNDVNPI